LRYYGNTVLGICARDLINQQLYMPHTKILPSSSILKYMRLSLPNAVRVTVSQGTPIWRSRVCCSLVRSTRIQVPPYLHHMKIVPCCPSSTVTLGIHIMNPNWFLFCARLTFLPSSHNRKAVHFAELLSDANTEYMYQNSTFIFSTKRQVRSHLVDYSLSSFQSTS
jgi:hypothetical protein